MYFSVRWILFSVRFAVEQLELLCRGTDVPIRVGLFGVLKAGKIMTELKFETFLGRLWLPVIRCAEKISQTGHQKTTRVRLFKA